MTDIISKYTDLRVMVGTRVRSLREFSGVPKGMMGTIDEYYETGRNHIGVMVAWDKPMSAWTDRKLRDGFGRDADFDETQWLEVVE